MCTVTYLALSDGFLLTSNRDENPNRARAEKPAIYDQNHPEVVFPRDPQGNGSWIAIHKNGSARCLLNGAYEVHQHNPPYRHSRGLVPLDSFGYDTAKSFYANYPTGNLEPFTLVWIDSDGLFEFRWDGKKKFLSQLNSREHHIWSSATLYAEEVRKKREDWFSDWLKKEAHFDQDKILYFHRFGGNGNKAEDLVMKKPGLIPQTISITSFLSSREAKKLVYEDLISKERMEKHI